LLARHSREARAASLDPRAILGRHGRRAAWAQLERTPCDRNIMFLLEPSQTGGYNEAIWSDEIRPDINPRGHSVSFHSA